MQVTEAGRVGGMKGRRDELWRGRRRGGETAWRRLFLGSVEANGTTCGGR